MIFFEECPVTERLEFDYDKVLIRLKCQEIHEHSEPGQFIEVKVPDGRDPLLRRPFSIVDTEKDGLWLIVQQRGRGSKKISEAEKVDIIGPLGNGFVKIQNSILIGGGSGIAPIIFFYRKYPELVESVILGFRTMPELNWKGIFSDKKVKLVTEDGSSGLKGLVTDYTPINPSKIYLACGPTTMMKALKNKISPDRLYLSLESYMGCGTGICMGCAIKKAKGEGYFRVCTEGPVFRADEIEL